MRAMVWTGYGPPEVLKLQEVDKPVPRTTRSSSKCSAATVTTGDCERRAAWSSRCSCRSPCASTSGLRKPPQNNHAGPGAGREVEAVGQWRHALQARRSHFGTTGFRFGAYAEYCCPCRKGSGDGVSGDHAGQHHL